MPNTTFNPSDKTAGISLSGGNLVAQGTAANQAVRAIDRRTSGKFYWEVTPTVSVANIGIGVANGAVALSSLSSVNAATSIGCAWATNSGAVGTLHIDGNQYLSVIGALVAGTPICVALDFDNRLIWFRNGAAGNWNGLAGANPATASGGYTSPFGATLAGYPLSLHTSPGSTHTANFGDAAFAGAVPSGFTGGFPTGSPTVVISNAGLVREALITTIPALQIGGMAREVLLANLATTGISGLVREVLVADMPVITVRQYAVTVVT